MKPQPEIEVAHAARLLSAASVKFCGILLASLNTANLVLLHAFITGPAMAQEFQVTGTLEYTLLSRDQLEFSTNKNFQVTVIGCRWLIRTSNFGSADYAEVGYENGEMFRLGSYRIGVGEQQSNTLAGLIERRDFPRDDGTCVNYLWLAYCSSCFFDNQTNALVEPIWLLDDVNLATEHFKVQAKWRRPQSGRLPMEVVYFNDGYFRVSEEKRRLVFKAPAPYDRGYVHAVYSVSASTNLEGCVVPTTCKFVRYQTRPNGKDQTDLAIRTLTEMTAARVTACTGSELFRPSFSGAFTTADLRFNASNPPVPMLAHTITNGMWPNSETLDHVYRDAVTTSARAQALPVRTKSPFKTRVIVALFAVAILGPLFFFLRHRHQNTNEPT